MHGPHADEVSLRRQREPALGVRVATRVVDDDVKLSGGGGEPVLRVAREALDAEAQEVRVVRLVSAAVDVGPLLLRKCNDRLSHRGEAIGDEYVHPGEGSSGQVGVLCNAEGLEARHVVVEHADGMGALNLGRDLHQPIRRDGDEAGVSATQLGHTRYVVTLSELVSGLGAHGLDGPNELVTGHEGELTLRNSVSPAQPGVMVGDGRSLMLCEAIRLDTATLVGKS